MPTVIAAIVLAFGELSPAQAFDPADLQTLQETGACPACDLSQADLRQGRSDHVVLAGANLTSTDFTGASLIGADLSGARMLGAHLKGRTVGGQSRGRQPDEC
ncbi:MAG: pentapeptide repeat-containing protein [Geminicoccaceae bacterium]